MNISIWIANTRDLIQPTEDHKGISRYANLGSEIYNSKNENWQSDGRKLVSAFLTEQIGQISKLTFTISEENFGYISIEGRNTQVWVFDYDRSNPYETDTSYPYVMFAGHVIDIVESIDKSGVITKTVTCADNMDYLNDTILTRARFTLTNGVTSVDILDRIISEHEHKKLGVRIEADEDWQRVLTSWGHYPDCTPYTNAYEYVIDWQPAFGFLQDWCEKWGYEWVLAPTAHYEEPAPENPPYRMFVYFGDKGKFNKTSSVILKDGVNIQSLTVRKDETNLITRMYPIGASKEENNHVTYTKISPESVSSQTPSIHVSSEFNCVDDDLAIAEYGVIESRQDWEDVTVANNLKTKALNAMKNRKGTRIEYSGTFLDLSGNEHPQDLFMVGDTHNLKHDVLKINVNVRIMYLKRNLLQPWKVEMKLGDVFENREQQQYLYALKNINERTDLMKLIENH